MNPKSYACTLAVSFPANYFFTPQLGSTQLNVYTVSEPIQRPGPSYNSAPANPFLFGTITIAAGQTAGKDLFFYDVYGADSTPFSD
jgi:hypothetical protein